jgi:hypothetical protein
MKHLFALVIGGLVSLSPALAEAPCDFKGVSVGSKMSPAEIMLALGVAQYKMNPAHWSFDKKMVLVDKYGLMAAADIEEWDIGPHCDDKSCIVPYGVGVGNANHIPVKVFVAFHDGQITEIEVSFAETYWDEIRPILDQKYGGDWKVEREDMAVTNFENKQSQMVQRISLQHVTDGTNQSTKDRCKIWATNVDIVFEHHDSFGPYHSEIVIQLISKNF